MTAGLLAACTHDALPPVAASAPPEPLPLAPALPAEAPSQYVVGDPARPTALTLLPLAGGASGVILEGQRFALRGSGVQAARDVADPPLVSGWRVPARLGGGFLFRASAALYASDTFYGLLRPIVAVPGGVTQVSFGPSAALVSADNGERWMIDLADGKRLPVSPPGLLDVAALDDGRAAALVEGGALMVSSDAGAHWIDASPRLRSPAHRLYVDAAPDAEPALWIETQAGQSARVMPGGRVAEYDAAPPAPAPPSLRPKPSGWREEEPPLRRAIRAGAPFGDGSALVVASGDLVRVDLATGSTETLSAGRLPPDAICAGTRLADDILFTCGRPGGGAFVASHAQGGAPVIEQTFQEAGRFVISDDGGIAFLGSCDRPSPRDRRMACVRAPGGAWQQYDPDAGVDAGSTPALQVVRWIPRADGDAIAVVSANRRHRRRLGAHRRSHRSAPRLGSRRAHRAAPVRAAAGGQSRQPRRGLRPPAPRRPLLDDDAAGNAARLGQSPGRHRSDRGRRGRVRADLAVHLRPYLRRRGPRPRAAARRPHLADGGPRLVVERGRCAFRREAQRLAGRPRVLAGRLRIWRSGTGSAGPRRLL